MAVVPVLDVLDCLNKYGNETYNDRLRYRFRHNELRHLQNGARCTYHYKIRQWHGDYAIMCDIQERWIAECRIFCLFRPRAIEASFIEEEEISSHC